MGDIVTEEPQTESRLSGATSRRVSPIAGGHASKLQEGDLITRTIDITHERVYMVPPPQGENCAEEREALARICFLPAHDVIYLSLPLPPGKIHSFLEYCAAGLSEGLDAGTRFQHSLVYEFVALLPQPCLTGHFQCHSHSTSTTTTTRLF